MPFSVGTLHESQSWVEHKQLMKVLLRLAEVLDVVMSYSPGLGLGHPTGVMDVWGSRWLSFFCPWVPWLSCHLEVLHGRWTADSPFPQSPTPSSECGQACVHSNPGTLRQQPQGLSRQWTHPRCVCGWSEVGSVIVSEAVQLFPGLDCKGTRWPCWDPHCRIPVQLQTGITWSASVGLKGGLRMGHHGSLHV